MMYNITRGVRNILMFDNSLYLDSEFLISSKSSQPSLILYFIVIRILNLDNNKYQLIYNTIYSRIIAIENHVLDNNLCLSLKFSVLLNFAQKSSQPSDVYSISLLSPELEILIMINVN